MIDTVKSLILDLCNESRNSEIWKEHLKVVAKISEELAEKLNADKEVCLIAAWLHDITKIDESDKKMHHVSGSKKAEQILSELGYPADKSKLVKGCIITHSSDKNYIPESLEEKILASADAMCWLDNFLGLVEITFVKKKLSLDEAREDILKKCNKVWNKICLDEAREISRPKFDAIKLLLN